MWPPFKTKLPFSSKVTSKLKIKIYIISLPDFHEESSFLVQNKSKRKHKDLTQLNFRNKNKKIK